MRAFSKLGSYKLLISALGAGVAGSAIGADWIFKKRTAFCDYADYAFDPNVPVNLPSGAPKWDYDWDKRQPYSLVPKPSGKVDENSEKKYHEELEKNKSKACRIVYLVRVGEYDDNKPECEQQLTKTGCEQAKILAERLAKIAETNKFKFSRIISSDSPVATQTAEILVKNLGKNMKISDKDPMLREGCPTLPDPQSPALNPEPKTLYSDGSRIEAAFRKYFYRAEPSQKEDSYEIIVCDANVIRYFVCRALQFPPQGWLRLMLAHGSINVISINPGGRVALRTLGEAGFYPPSKLTA